MVWQMLLGTGELTVYALVYVALVGSLCVYMIAIVMCYDPNALIDWLENDRTNVDVVPKQWL